MGVTNQALPTGYQLLNYRVDRQISRGGFSIVYRAFDDTGAPVAIKEYLPASLVLRTEGDIVRASSAENLTSFRYGMKCFFEEGRALAKINHPNVVRVLNFFRANETVYMVMRYERGRTLQQQIQLRLLRVGHLERGLLGLLVAVLQLGVELAGGLVDEGPGPDHGLDGARLAERAAGTAGAAHLRQALGGDVARQAALEPGEALEVGAEDELLQIALDEYRDGLFAEVLIETLRGPVVGARTAHEGVGGGAGMQAERHHRPAHPQGQDHADGQPRPAAGDAGESG